MHLRLAPTLALAGLVAAGVRPSAAQNPAPPAPSAGARPAGALPQLGRAPLRDVVAALTDSEKVRLVVGGGIGLPPEVPVDMFPPQLRAPAPTPDDSAWRVPGAVGRTHAVRRLGIPSLILSDGPAGVRIDPIRRGPDGKPDSSRTYYATAWPAGTLLASSWDTALVRRVAAAFGAEAREYGVDVMLAPGVNLHRNPLGGRNFEYYSEDPLVSGLMAAAMVDGVQAAGVGMSVKHFVGNEQEFNRTRLNSAISERALRELYLRAFEIAVRRARPWTVMSSYNLVNGTHTAESRALLTDLLRGEWGFGGLVMSDWYGGVDPAAMLAAGNDLIMPGTGVQMDAVRAALAGGRLTRAQLDTNVTRVLELVLRSPAFRRVPHSDRPDLRAHAAVARQAAAESMVLLRNEAPRGAAGGPRPALPLAAGLARGATVAAFGNTSYDLVAGGTGSGNVNRAYTISVAQGLDSAGLPVDTVLAGAYTRYLAAERAKLPPRNPMMDLLAPPKRIAELAPNAALVRDAAGRAAAAVVTIGRVAGEGGDRKVADDFELTAAERAVAAPGVGRVPRPRQAGRGGAQRRRPRGGRELARPGRRDPPRLAARAGGRARRRRRARRAREPVGQARDDLPDAVRGRPVRGRLPGAHPPGLEAGDGTARRAGVGEHLRRGRLRGLPLPPHLRQGAGVRVRPRDELHHVPLRRPAPRGDA
jgi:beta-glucosidase